MQWASLRENVCPELELLHAIPNGGERHPAVAAKMKAEGVKAGVPDTHLPVARRGFHGLYIEMKVIYEDGTYNVTSKDQEKWLRRLDEEGYFTAVCYTWVEAAEVVAQYLGRPDLLDGINGEDSYVPQNNW